MKNTARVIGVAAWFSLAICSQLRAATIELPLYGFQIDALDAAPDASNPTTVLQTLLPPTEGFAPNIIVQIQPYTGTIKDYVTLSRRQFEQMKWNVISDQQSGDNEWSVEYTGSLQGADLHFYARAVSTNGKVYLVTATAKESQWTTVSDTLRKHVDSFKLTPTSPSSTPGTP
jgi:PsbP